MAVVLGVVFLMVARPGLAGSLGMVGTFIALGLACGLLMSRRAMPLPALSGRDQH
jgi:TRAP-type mannitol/chloroaromatic compound transport system permease large subunit